MKAIVFDLDETLVDRKGSLSIYASKLHSDFRAFIEMTELEFVTFFHRLDGNGRIPREKFFANLADDASINISAKQISEHFAANAWSTPILFPGVLALMQALRVQHWRIGVITNGNVHPQTAKLKNSGLSKWIDCAVISAAFGSEKPDRSIFDHLIAQLDIDPRQSWFIGDDPLADMWGAKQAGFNTIWVERYIPWPDELTRCYDACIMDTRELLGVIADTA